jgi:hypothetical protein
MRKVVFFTVGIVFLSAAAGQSITPYVINSTGSSAVIQVQNHPFHLDWNVGEMALVNTMRYIAPNQNNNLFITNGFLNADFGPDHGDDDTHPKAGFLTTSEINVHPNPAIDNVEITVSINGNSTMRLVLYDVMGKQVYTREIAVSNKVRMAQVPVAALPQGTYMLSVYLNSPDSKMIRRGSFKILKIH